MPSKLENRVSALEKSKPAGRVLLVWKDSEAHRKAEAEAGPGDTIQILRWLEPGEDSQSPLESR